MNDWIFIDCGKTKDILTIMCTRLFGRFRVMHVS